MITINTTLRVTLFILTFIPRDKNWTLTDTAHSGRWVNPENRYENET